jgi:8-oxo-dGTP pyrophosphatase MutT (NUDIX family)
MSRARIATMLDGRSGGALGRLALSQAALALLVVGGCRTPDTQRVTLAAEPTVPPNCAVAPACRNELRGNAGCLIRFGERVLVVRHASSGKLTVPGGRSRPHESAQCTAHRETWEEAGLAVVVGPLVTTLDNGFHLFACGADAGERSRLRQAVAEGTACSHTDEISAVMLVAADELTPANYRFPRYLDRVKLALAAAATDLR